MLTILLLSSAYAEAEKPALEQDETTAEESETQDPPKPLERGFINTTLENGLQVSILTEPAHPIVSTQTWVEIGSAHEADNEKGFAHMFEHLMFGQTENYGPKDYNRHHIRYGGYENAYTAFDNTVYISIIPPEGHSEVLKMESDRLVNLILEEENLTNEKKIVTEELRMRGENNPFSRLLNIGLGALFGEHPYGSSPAGTKEDIQSADLELCRKFYAGYYQPENLHLVVVGPVNGEDTLEQVKALYGEMDKPDAIKAPEVPKLNDWEFPSDIRLKEDIPPMKIAAQMFVVPDATHEDYWALRTMGSMLVGSGQDLFREEMVTKRGKALEAGSFVEDIFKQGGMAVFGAVSLPTRSRRSMHKHIGLSIDALAEKEWLTEENLLSARKGLEIAEYQKIYDADAQADAIGWAHSRLGNAESGVSGYADQVSQVTLEDVSRVFDTYIANAEPVKLFIKKGKGEEQ